MRSFVLFFFFLKSNELLNFIRDTTYERYIQISQYGVDKKKNNNVNLFETRHDIVSVYKYIRRMHCYP